MCWPEKPCRCVWLLCACSCEPSLTFDLLKQEQWIPTKSEIKLTMMRTRIWDLIQMKMKRNDLQKTKGVTHNKNNNKNKSFHPNLFTIHLPQQNQLPGRLKKMKKLSIHPKMVAVVEGASPPFPVTYSLWKAQDGQKRLFLAMNLLSGIEGKAIAPEID